jgi:phage gp16-like protein
MKQLGAEFVSKNHRRDPPDPLSRKIRALWLSLHKAGIVRDASDNALNRYIMRQVKVRSMEWLDTPKAIAVIESLKKWKEREGLDHED